MYLLSMSESVFVVNVFLVNVRKCICCECQKMYVLPMQSEKMVVWKELTTGALCEPQNIREISLFSKSETTMLS